MKKVSALIKTCWHWFTGFWKNLFTNHENRVNHPRKGSSSIEVSSEKSSRTKKFKFVWSHNYEEKSPSPKAKANPSQT